MDLKAKTVHGLFWSFIDSFANQGVTFVVGIILARLLTPYEFGLIGMLTIFIAISQSFIDSGFSSALIRKKECSQADYSTVFYFNLLAGILLYAILFLSAGLISNFYNEPQLISLIKILSLSLIFSSLSIIQRTILTKDLKFQIQTRISVISALGSGLIGLYLAINGYGVWSLVWQNVSKFAFNAIFLWVWIAWKPSYVFSKSSFKDLFSFGSKLLLSGLIDTIYRNVYYLIIGKYFSARELGYYTRADQFRMLPSQNLNVIISRVSYPVLATIQDDKEKLKASYRRLIQSSMLLTFPLMLGMAAVAKPLIVVLIGEKWLPAVPYLQLLCFLGIFYPLHALNLNMLQVKGRSDLFLKLEIIKKILAVPIIIIGINFGIIPMIHGMIINTLFAYYLNSYWSGKFIDYSFLRQLLDILPIFFIAAATSAIVYLFGIFYSYSDISQLIIQLILGAILFIGTLELIKFENYKYLKALIIGKIRSR